MSYYQKECPNCSETIGINTAKCQHCSFILEEPITSATVLDPSEIISLDETESGQSYLAYRIAAIILFLVAILNILSILQGYIQHGAPDIPRILSLFIDIALGIGLLQFRSGARIVVLLSAPLGGIVFVCRAFDGGDLLGAIIMSVIQLGLFGSLVLLLTGQSKTWRLILGGSLFGLFTFFPTILLLLLSTLMSILQ